MLSCYVALKQYKIIIALFLTEYDVEQYNMCRCGGDGEGARWSIYTGHA